MMRRLAQWIVGAALLMACLAPGATSPLLAQATPSVTAGGAPVVFADDTLFSLYGSLGAFTAEERAAAVMGRLEHAASAISSGADTIGVVDADTHTDLVVGDIVLMSVLDADAKAAGKPRLDVATADARIATTALAAAKGQNTVRALVVGAALTLLATLALLLLLRLLRVVVPRLEAMIAGWRGTRIPALRIQKFEVISSARIADFLAGVVGILRVAAIIVLLYIYVPLVLSFFPWTAPYAGKIVGSVVTPLKHIGQSFIDYLPNLLFIVVIVFVTRYVLKFIHLLFDALDSGAVVLPGFYKEWGQPTYKIVRFLVLAFVLVVMFPYLPGANSDAFKGVSLFLGALFTLGSSSAIANIVAGTVLTFTRAYQVGDRVQIGETVGEVIEKSLLVTRVRTIKNLDITVPNAQVLSSHITNFSTVASTGGIILHTSVTIGYDAPWRQVHQLLIAAAKSIPGVLTTPAPFVLQTGLDDFYVSYEINVYSDQPAGMAQTYSDLHQAIQDEFNKGGVEILSPHFRQLRDGNQVAIPAEYLPKDYVAPTFRVTTDRSRE